LFEDEEIKLYKMTPGRDQAFPEHICW